MPKNFGFSGKPIVLFFSALLLVVPAVAFGQATNVTDDQSVPAPGVGHDYIKMLSETVSPSNGQVSIRIGTPMPPGRKLSIPFAFAYDSNGAHHLQSTGPGLTNWFTNGTFLSQGGWGYSLPQINMAYDTMSYMSPIDGQEEYCSYYTDFLFQDPAGGRHALGIAVVDNPQSPDCQFAQPQPYSVLTGGDDFYQATVAPNSPFAVAVANADGTVYNFPDTYLHQPTGGGSSWSSLPGTIEDRNGNMIYGTDSGNGAFYFTDTLGRNVLSSSGFGTNGNTVTLLGLNPYTVDWGSAYSNFGVSSTLVDPDPSCSPTLGNENGSQPVITSITLPNGEQYTFSYDSTYGLLNQITYPSGGWVKYTWELNSNSDLAAFPDFNGSPYGCEYTYGMPAVATRTVSFDGVNTALVQSFSYSTTWNLQWAAWTSRQTVVTTQDYVRGNSFTTTYNYAPYSVAVQPNDSSIFAQQVGLETSVITTDFSGSTLRTVNKNWFDQYEMQGQQVIDNGTVTSDQFFLFRSPGNIAGNQITAEYECGSGQTCYSASQSSPPSAYTRLTTTTYASFATTPIYPASPSIFDRPSSVVVSTSSGRVAETDYSYDGASLTGTSVTGHDYTNYSSSYTARGNATSMSKWVNTSGSSLTWNYTYDDTGQMLSSSDPKSQGTSYSYADSFSGCGSAGGSTGAYLTKITDAKGFTESFSYRYCDGQLNSVTDRNSQTTTYAYADSLNRLTGISYADGGNTTYGFGANDCVEPTSTTILLSGSSNYTASATLDGVCHVTDSAVTSDPVNPDYTDTTYDGTGRVMTVSNAYRSKSDSTYGLTTTTYDSLGRTLSVAAPDGSTTTTVYAGLSKTVTDAAGITRILTNDNLERLATVTENPAVLNYLTSYTYDVLNDLLTVSQGSQSRIFVYDSLARLTSATNPESGTTTYTYPMVSNPGACSGDPMAVCRRTDARGITTIYQYNDPLNRLTSKTYSDNTPPVQLSYDRTSVGVPGGWISPTLGYTKGRLSETIAGNIYTVQDYDPMGRPKNYWQCTPRNCGSGSMWATLYNYDLAGDVTSYNHPAGFTITQLFNNAREVQQITSTLNDSTHPGVLATGPNGSIQYTPWGAVSILQDGCVGSGCTAVQEYYFYNQQLQMGVVELGTTGSHSAFSCRVYNYYAQATNASACSESLSAWPSSSNNNGDVAGYYYLDNVNTGLQHSANYTYDGVNRLTTAVAAGQVVYNQAYTFTGDGSTGQYGNMGCTTGGPACVAFAYSATSNRITTSGYTYDAAGDVTGDGTNTYQWDAEGRLTKVLNGAGTAISTNTYNALGQRVRDVSTTETTDEAYGADGTLLWRYTGGDSYTRAFVPFEGTLLAEYYSGGTIFDHRDELGSLSTSTDYTGNNLNEKLFYPFGEMWTGAAVPNLGTQQTFAKLPDYDPETDEYNTLNRHYSPSGRWMSPDPGGVKVVKLDYPQTWNMYAYVTNNPTTLTDPTGLCGDPTDFKSEADCAHDRDAQNEVNKAPQQQNPNQAVGNTTEGSLAKVLTNEDGSLSTPKKGDPQELVDGKTALANAIYNNANLDHPEKVAPDTGTASAQDSQIMQGVVTSRTNGGADPVQGRHYYGTSHNASLKSRSALNGLKGKAGRETVYARFGPFHDSMTPHTPTYIYIYNDPGH